MGNRNDQEMFERLQRHVRSLGVRPKPPGEYQGECSTLFLSVPVPDVDDDVYVDISELPDDHAMLVVISDCGHAGWLCCKCSPLTINRGPYDLLVRADQWDGGYDLLVEAWNAIWVNQGDGNPHYYWKLPEAVGEEARTLLYEYQQGSMPMPEYYEYSELWVFHQMEAQTLERLRVHLHEKKSCSCNGG